MKKQKWLLSTVCVLTALTASALAAPESAVRSDASFLVNGQAQTVAAYNIGGYNYFKLRDLADALNGTSNQFEVSWDASRNQIDLLSGQAYTGEPESGELSYTAEATPTTAGVLLDGSPIYLTAYNIGGNNYFKLRDLGDALHFGVLWEEDSRSMAVYTLSPDWTLTTRSAQGATDQMSAGYSKARWTSVPEAYLYENIDGRLAALTKTSDGLWLDLYDPTDLSLTESRQIPMELEKFGGFLAGEDYNYVVFGQDNTAESDAAEVVRVVKYSKDFARLGEASIDGGETYTVLPFECGRGAMAEGPDGLVLHTGRERYTTEDGLNHQSQLTIVIDPETMTLTNTIGRFQDNHVSHSFNQFVRYDGAHHVLVDHGDAYPRSVVLSRYTGSGYQTVDLFQIPGAIGANCTGVTVGGFEVSPTHYLVAINTIDHSKATGYTSYVIEGLDADERDIVLLISEKSNTSTAAVRQLRLTDCVGKGKLASTPRLVRVSDDRFVVLWETFDLDGKSLGVSYAAVNGSGQQQGTVQSLPDAHLSADCQPIVVDGKIVWFCDVEGDGRLFYAIDSVF